LSGWSKAATRGDFPSRKVGRNRYVRRADAKRFAENWEARREQRIVGSLSKDPDADPVVSALKKIQQDGRDKRRGKSK